MKLDIGIEYPCIRLEAVDGGQGQYKDSFRILPLFCFSGGHTEQVGERTIMLKEEKDNYDPHKPSFAELVFTNAKGDVDAISTFVLGPRDIDGFYSTSREKNDLNVMGLPEAECVYLGYLAKSLRCYFTNSDNLIHTGHGLHLYGIKSVDRQMVENVRCKENGKPELAVSCDTDITERQFIHYWPCSVRGYEAEGKQFPTTKKVASLVEQCKPRNYCEFANYVNSLGLGLLVIQHSWDFQRPKFEDRVTTLKALTPAYPGISGKLEGLGLDYIRIWRFCDENTGFITDCISNRLANHGA